MSTIEDESGTTILHRTTEYAPRRSWRTWLIGRPLPTADAPHQTVGRLIGLAVFASDALSSTAYATQEMLFILAAAGTAAFGLAFPISIAIVILLAIVTISYQQTIYAYPGGGGAYIVARDNLGGVRLVILDSPYRLLLEPLLAYIEQIADRRQPNEAITVVVPQFVPRHWWNNLLHTQAAWMLRLALLLRPDIVIIDVPYQVE
jgi:amino acid transporter